jgi:hypothetical protein
MAAKDPKASLLKKKLRSLTKYILETYYVFLTKRALIVQHFYKYRRRKGPKPYKAALHENRKGTQREKKLYKHPKAHENASSPRICLLFDFLQPQHRRELFP